MSERESETVVRIKKWFESKDWKPFPFQQQAWVSVLARKHGLLNAPTGSGKTYALFTPFLIKYLAQEKKKTQGVKLIWITPIRALAKEISQASQRMVDGLEADFTIGVRHGDTSQAERAKQKKRVPDMLITTPETLHLLLAQKDASAYFKQLQGIVVDEWHELLGSKRGVQIELALSRLKTLCPSLCVWGISATIGNLEEAKDVLLGVDSTQKSVTIIADITKEIVVESVIPNEIEEYPWSGHLGLKMLPYVAEIIAKSTSTLVFTNTRAQAEVWYQRLLEFDEDLAGTMALHHGSISRELRDWVEESLHLSLLKAVVCTSSLDLGVDFRPVETIVQIGGPKGVARFIQRAGRSGHRPGAVSKIYFVPTNSLELLEASALRHAIENNSIEKRKPLLRSFDVLVQYLCTLAVGEGFLPAQIFQEIKTTFCFQSVTASEWQWILQFITTGGQSLHSYTEYHKVIVDEGIYKITSRRTAMRHRLSIGTIVSDTMLSVKLFKGGYLGSIEEWFASSLKPGDVFWFAGRPLELIHIKDMQVSVRKSNQQTGKIPSWQGGRMPLSSQLSNVLRMKMHEVLQGDSNEPELLALKPVFELQSIRSIVPNQDQLLVEYFKTKEGYHLVVYPFDGRFVHEGIASLLAFRLSLFQPISFSLAYNDYGFELLSDSEIPIQAIIDSDLFTTHNLEEDLKASVNSTEMARRKFRDIASISGLVFKGFPGNYKPDRHVQSSSQLLFDVFQEYDAENILYQQAFDEVFDQLLEVGRLREALLRIEKQQIVVTYPNHPTPFAFGILVDRLREKLSSETIEDRVKKMISQMEAS